MPLQADERAEIELIITGYINEAPLESLDDLSQLIDALKIIVGVEGIQVDLNERISATVEGIREFLRPEEEDLVSSPQDTEEFIGYCLEVISTEVQRLEHLSDAEKEALIQTRQNGQYAGGLLNTHSHRPLGLTSYFSNELTASLLTLDMLLLAVRYQEEIVRRQDLNRLWQQARAIPGPSFIDESPIDQAGYTNTANYGEWKRTFDTSHISHATWEKHYDLREENRHCVKHLSLQKRPSHFQLSLESSNHWLSDSRPLPMFEANNLRMTLAFAMVRAGITKDTPQVTRFPKTTAERRFEVRADILEINGSAEEVTSLLERVFTAIESLEGAGNIPQAMRDDMLQALRPQAPAPEADRIANYTL